MKIFKTFFKNMKFHNITMMRASFARFSLKVDYTRLSSLRWPRNCQLNSEGMNLENEIL